MKKSNRLKEIAMNWFIEKGRNCETPSFSYAKGTNQIFNDNNSADEIEFYITEKGEEEGFVIEDTDIVAACLAAQKELGIESV